MEHNSAIYEEVYDSEKPGELKLESNGCYGCVKKSSINMQNSEKSGSKKVVVALVLTFATLVVLLGAIAASTVFALAEISKLKSEIAFSGHAMLQQGDEVVNAQEKASILMNMQLLRDLEARLQQLQTISNNTAELIAALDDRINQSQTSNYQQYSTLQDFSNTTAEMVAALDARMVARLNNFSNRTLQQLKNSISAIYFSLNVSIRTCDELPESFSAGYYYLVSSIGSAVRQYCPSITTRCGQTGRWRSVANLDMTNSTQQCLGNLTQDIYSNKRLCVRSSNSSGCSSVQLPTNTAYISVCGLVRAYQFGSTDAFYSYLSSTPTIDSHYVDGVSITQGSPRQHIWTFAAAKNEISGRVGCVCISGGSNSRPSFVGNDYFCDTGTSTGTERVFYGDDPLWDGTGCGSTNNCCSFNTPPWFYKELLQPTSDDIELRVCCDQYTNDEDIAIEAVTIFVK